MLTWLHAPLAQIPLLLAVVAFDVWLFGFHGVAGGLRSALAARLSEDALWVVVSDPAFADEARTLATVLAERGIGIVYGGGKVGLMGVIAIQLMPAGSSPVAIVLVSVLAGGLAGMLYAGLLAFASINLNADQTIGGTALNLLATALAMVVAKGVNHSASAKLDYSNRAFIYDFGPLTVNIFLFIGIVALILSYIVLYKTRLGLRLRACGEHPQAADSVGINVYKMRYIGVLISGVLGGIGGMAYIIPSVSSWNFEVGVSGAGFLALAVMIFGQWKPFRIFFAAVFFALFKSLANIASSIPFLAGLGWTQNMYNMIPFIASMIILAFTSKKSRAPKAEGIPYDKGSR